MSVLVVGSIALDTVKTPMAEHADLLGGSASYAAVSASFFTGSTWWAWWETIFRRSTSIILPAGRSTCRLANREGKDVPLVRGIPLGPEHAGYAERGVERVRAFHADAGAGLPGDAVRAAGEYRARPPASCARPDGEAAVRHRRYDGPLDQHREGGTALAAQAGGHADPE